MSEGSISERQAAALFEPVGISREQARLLLRSGVAGPGLRVGGERAGGVTVYDERRVRAVAESRFVDESALADVCPNGVYVARLSRSRTVDVTRPWQEQAADVAHQPALTSWTSFFILLTRELAGGALPWVLTISGFVAFGAETTRWKLLEDGSMTFELRPPGPWFEAVERRWFLLGRGRHWVFWRPTRLQQWPTCPPPRPAS